VQAEVGDGGAEELAGERGRVGVGGDAGGREGRRGDRGRVEGAVGQQADADPAGGAVHGEVGVPGVGAGAEAGAGADADAVVVGLVAPRSAEQVDQVEAHSGCERGDLGDRARSRGVLDVLGGALVAAVQGRQGVEEVAEHGRDGYGVDDEAAFVVEGEAAGAEGLSRADRVRPCRFVGGEAGGRGAVAQGGVERGGPPVCAGVVAGGDEVFEAERAVRVEPHGPDGTAQGHARVIGQSRCARSGPDEVSVGWGAPAGGEREAHGGVVVGRPGVGPLRGQLGRGVAEGLKAGGVEGGACEGRVDHGALQTDEVRRPSGSVTSAETDAGVSAIRAVTRYGSAAVARRRNRSGASGGGAPV
jgi:hypothetical protein